MQVHWKLPIFALGRVRISFSGVEALVGDGICPFRDTRKASCQYHPKSDYLDAFSTISPRVFYGCSDQGSCRYEQMTLVAMGISSVTSSMWNVEDGF